MECFFCYFTVLLSSCRFVLEYRDRCYRDSAVGGRFAFNDPRLVKWLGVVGDGLGGLSVGGQLTLGNLFFGVRGDLLFVVKVVQFFLNVTFFVSLATTASDGAVG